MKKISEGLVGFMDFGGIIGLTLVFLVDDIILLILQKGKKKKMGNKCSNCTDFLQQNFKRPLNEISQQYLIIDENSCKNVAQQYISYPENYPFMLNMLRLKQLKFYDKYFNAKTHGSSMLGFQFTNEEDLKWVRITDLASPCNINRSLLELDLNNPPSQLFNKKNTDQEFELYEIFQWMGQSNPKLKNSILQFQSIPECGFILLYLPLFGSHEYPTQIVLDDFIPTIEGKYFRKVRRAKIWMIILQKALAKIKGSYSFLSDLSTIELFQLVTGTPILINNPQKSPTFQHIRTKLFKPKNLLYSHQISISGETSKYFKLIVSQDCEVGICLWQFPKEFGKINEAIMYANVIMELIDINHQKHQKRIGYSSVLQNDKTILRFQQKNGQQAQQILHKGNYILHIYNRTAHQPIHSSLVATSSKPLRLVFRNDYFHCSKHKQNMIQNYYQLHHNSITKLSEGNNIFSRFIWDGFRGILCLKNEGAFNVELNLKIHQFKRKNIKIQDNDNYAVNVAIESGKYTTVKFIRNRDSDIGNFYQIGLPKKQ